jgi:hypothetical protein
MAAALVLKASAARTTPEAAMSAMGQKQTWTLARGKSVKCHKRTSRFIPSLPELTIGWGVASKGRKSMVQCPTEPNIIVAITSTETRKGEVGVSKFIPSHLICLFFDEAFFG